MTRALIVTFYVGLSVAIHFALVAAAPATAAPPRRPPPPTFMRLSPEPEPEPELEAQPEPPPPPSPKAPPRVKPVAGERAASEPAASKPEAEEPVPAPVLTGTTLASDASSTWSAPAGSGAERAGLIQTGAVGITPSSARGDANAVGSGRPGPTAAPSGPAIVPLAQLSRKPSPPPLGAALERFYPQDARRLGRSGEAVVRARIDERGALREAQIKTESSPGFGAACQKALLGSVWTPPLDRAGRPAATWVTYRCKFRSD